MENMGKYKAQQNCVPILWEILYLRHVDDGDDEIRLP